MPQGADTHAPLTNDETDREIVISRVIEGPRQLVFLAYSDVEHLSEWWGPDGFTTSTHSFDFRVGGVWDFVMHAPDGTDFDNWIQWLEIVPPERLVAHHGERPDDPQAFTQTITFEEVEGGTLVAMRAVFPTAERRDQVVREFGAIEGGHQHLARLNGYIRTVIGAA